MPQCVSWQIQSDPGRRLLRGGRALLQTPAVSPPPPVSALPTGNNNSAGKSLPVQVCHGTHCTAILTALIMLLSMMLAGITWGFFMCYRCVPPNTQQGIAGFRVIFPSRKPARDSVDDSVEFEGSVSYSAAVVSCSICARSWLPRRLKLSWEELLACCQKLLAFELGALQSKVTGQVTVSRSNRVALKSSPCISLWRLGEGWTKPFSRGVSRILSRHGMQTYA